MNVLKYKTQKLSGLYLRKERSALGASKRGANWPMANALKPIRDQEFVIKLMTSIRTLAGISESFARNRTIFPKIADMFAQMGACRRKALF